MAWTTTLIAQNGNSSVPYLVPADPSLNVFDVVAVGLDAGRTSVSVTSHVPRRDIGDALTHEVTVRVLGAAAAAFRIRGAVV
ncbi:MAG: hypothetical protein ACFCVF_06630 [Kineosporiaceae bacterium]|jgi:hypothetical protein